MVQMGPVACGLWLLIWQGMVGTGRMLLLSSWHCSGRGRARDVPRELGPKEQGCSAGSSDNHLFCQLVQVRPVALVVADVAEDGWLGEVVAAWSPKLLCFHRFH